MVKLLWGQAHAGNSIPADKEKKWAYILGVIYGRKYTSPIWRALASRLGAYPSWAPDLIPDHRVEARMMKAAFWGGVRMPQERRTGLA
jgi:hypothetical protein